MGHAHAQREEGNSFDDGGTGAHDPEPDTGSKNFSAKGKHGPKRHKKKHGNDLSYANPYVDDAEPEVETDNKASFDKKKYEHISDGTASASHSKKTTTHGEGGSKDVHEDETSATLDKSGLSIENKQSDTHNYGGGDVESGTSRSEGIDINGHGGHVKVGDSKKKRAGEHEHEQGREVSVGVQDGKFDGEMKHTDTVKEGDKTVEKSGSWGIEDGKVARGWGTKTEHDLGDGKTTSDESENKIAVGTEGASGEHTNTHTNADGSSTSNSYGGELGENKQAVDYSHTRTDKDGNSFTVSAHAGCEVEASDPVQVGKKWVVTWTRTKSAGGSVGASKKGIGGSAGAEVSDFETGTRSFDSEKEADEFKEHAAARIRDIADAKSVQGALGLEIGESRGDGSAIEGTLSGNASLEGASIGASGHEKKSSELDVRRVSANEFDVTVMSASEEGGDLEAGGFGVKAKAGTSSGQHQSVTYRFDLSTSEGQAAFEKFCSDKQAPGKGGRQVATDEGKEHSTYDGVSLAGLGEGTFTSKTWEDASTDEDGNKTEDYGGSKSYDASAGTITRWLGGKDQHSSVELVSEQYNDQEGSYSAVAKTDGGGDAAFNRGKLQHMFGVEEVFAGKDMTASGAWALSADIPKEAIHDFEADNPMFAGKSDDDKMRVLSQYIADKGADGINHILNPADETNAPNKATWDLELKGDKNFPGKAGRMETTAKIAKLGELLAAGGGTAPTVLGQVQSEMDALEARRKAVSDPKQYTDLPDALRAEQVAMIDDEIKSYEMVRHQAAIETTKLNPGEDVGDITMRASDEKNYDQIKDPKQRELTQLRDQIAIEDAQIQEKQKECMEARAALMASVGHYTDMHKEGAQGLSQRRDRATQGGNVLNDVQSVQYVKLDGLRMSFLQAMNDPDQAMQIGKVLLGQLQAQEQIVYTEAEDYARASRAQVQVMADGGTAGHADYWSETTDMMDSDTEAEDAYDDEQLVQQMAANEAQTGSVGTATLQVRKEKEDARRARAEAMAQTDMSLTPDAEDDARHHQRM